MASQLVTWSPRDGPAVALPEIMDACSLSWSAGEDSWQLLSPIFGVLMLQQVDNTQRAVMPVAPLLEAAVTRQIAGVPRFWQTKHVLHSCEHHLVSEFETNFRVYAI